MEKEQVKQFLKEKFKGSKYQIKSLLFNPHIKHGEFVISYSLSRNYKFFVFYGNFSYDDDKITIFDFRSLDGSAVNALSIFKILGE